ncbi:MAG: SUF system NifU family Fe-S cluster assembly protein [Lachnospiraceae bacterium]|nr:SUF system NifU family Fe-S cluster assembly protein [Lachnospiraceae bacterium]
MSETFYNEIINEHNLRPYHKHSIEGANFTLEGVNPSCGDDIILNLVVDDDGIIKDGAYEGEGCAISQASADIMLDLVIGKSKEEALRLADIFMRMIKEGITDEEKDELEEAGILESVSHMPARVKCAVLGWRTITEMFTEAEEE